MEGIEFRIVYFFLFLNLQRYTMTDDNRSDKLLGHFACRATQYRNHYPIDVAINQTSLTGHTSQDHTCSDFTDDYSSRDFTLTSTIPVGLSPKNFSVGKIIKHSFLADSLSGRKNIF